MSLGRFSRARVEEAFEGGGIPRHSCALRRLAELDRVLVRDELRRVLSDRERPEVRQSSSRGERDMEDSHLSCFDKDRGLNQDVAPLSLTT